MAQYQYDIIIIGGGSGGLTGARLGAALGARVVLVDKERLGGDCLRYGCVPSKTLIHVAKVAHGAKKAAELGLGSAILQVDMRKVSDHVQEVIGRVEEGEKVYIEGVTVRFGKAQFKSAHELDLDGKMISSRAFIIATGSRPQIPAVEGLKEAGYLTNEDVFDLSNLPASLVVVGGGPIGVELAQSFARLGSKVTIIHGPNRILPKEEPEVSEAVAKALVNDGVTLYTGARMKKVHTANGKKIVEAARSGATISVEGDEILLALGRQPNLEGLNLEAAGVKYEKKGISVDEYMQTSTNNIYAVGDVVGGYLFTHVAAYQAGVAIRNTLVPVRKKVDYKVVPWVTFTDPEAAHVGQTEEEAAKEGPVRIIRLPWHEIDRAQAEGETEGFIKLIIAQKNDKLLGAHLVGGRAGELLGELALAMRHNLGLDDILDTIHAYPTLSTGVQQAAFEAYLESSAISNARKIIRPVLSLRG